MTICLAVYFRGCAVLVADTLGSNMENAPRGFTPEEWVSSSTAIEGKATDLFTKICHPSANSVMSFAGYGGNILAFAKELPDAIRQKPDCYRPMQWVSWKADEFNDSVGELGRFSVIGFQETTTGSDLGLNWISRHSQRREISGFDRFLVAGTGAEYVTDFIRDFINTHDIDCSEGEDFMSLVFALGALNLLKLFGDFSKVPLSDTWGGYLQTRIWNHHGKHFMRTPDWLYSVVGIDLDVPGYSPRYSRDVVIYRDVGFGQMTAVKFLERETRVHSWEFKNPFGDASIIVPGGEDNGVSANKLATLLFDVKKNGCSHYLTKTLSGHDMDHLNFRLGEGKATPIGLLIEYLELVASEARKFAEG